MLGIELHKNWENKSDGVYHLVADSKYVSNPQEQTNAAFSLCHIDIQFQDQKSPVQSQHTILLYR